MCSIYISGCVFLTMPKLHAFSILSTSKLQFLPLSTRVYSSLDGAMIWLQILLLIAFIKTITFAEKHATALPKYPCWTWRQWNWFYCIVIDKWHKDLLATCIAILTLISIRRLQWGTELWHIPCLGQIEGWTDLHVAVFHGENMLSRQIVQYRDIINKTDQVNALMPLSEQHMCKFEARLVTVLNNNLKMVLKIWHPHLDRRVVGRMNDMAFIA